MLWKVDLGLGIRHEQFKKKVENNPILFILTFVITSSQMVYLIWCGHLLIILFIFIISYFKQQKIINLLYKVVIFVCKCMSMFSQIFIFNRVFFLNLNSQHFSREFVFVSIYKRFLGSSELTQKLVEPFLSFRIQTNKPNLSQFSL